MSPVVKRFVREPLVHFLAIGLLLFAVFAIVNDDRRDSGNRIEITNADIEQLVLIFRKQWQRDPDQQELQSLIDSRIREEVLYREALALGLDEDDTIVRRRLAQKVEFLMADAGAVTEPDDETLQAYYQKNAEFYREPPRLTFNHIYFNIDRRGEQAVKDARALLVRMRAAGPPVTHAAEQGDPLMLPRVYAHKPTDQIARDFGHAFAEQISKLETKQWHGPIVSGYGLHLVYVDSREESRLPPLEQIRTRVSNDWLVEQRHAADARIYERLRSRYEISVAGQQGTES